MNAKEDVRMKMLHLPPTQIYELQLKENPKRQTDDYYIHLY